MLIYGDIFDKYDTSKRYITINEVAQPKFFVELFIPKLYKYNLRTCSTS